MFRMDNFSVLVIDDEFEIRNAIEENLVDKGFTVLQAADGEQAMELLGVCPVDIGILDIKLPGMDGLEILAEMRKRYPGTEVIMMTAHGEMESVIQAMRLGAIDFFRKPFSLKDLNRSIEKTSNYLAFKQSRMNLENTNFAMIDEVMTRIGHQIIFESREMQEILQFVGSIAGSGNTSVLIKGESGTGKDIIARAIHYMSPRKENPFNAVNCASIPRDLFESEFFGHTKGAFTGAVNERKGWFEATHRGTLLLDEIGDLHLSSQPKLLRVLEDHKVVKVGSSKVIPVDVRVIAATNNHLEQLVEQKLFRPDLFYRLNSVVLNIPPLRERKEDIIPMFHLFLKQYSERIGKPIDRVSPDVSEWLMEYSFPGNVRELKHMVERAVILSTGHILTLKHFTRTVRTGPKPASRSTADTGSAMSLDEQARTLVLQAMFQAGNVKTEAARILNISRQALDRRLQKFNIKL